MLLPLAPETWDYRPACPALVPVSFCIHRSQFSVDIQTTSSKGLVFYTGPKNSFMALYLSEGHVIFALGAEGKRLRLRSKKKYHDGKWHTVRAGTVWKWVEHLEITPSPKWSHVPNILSKDSTSNRKFHAQSLITDYNQNTKYIDSLSVYIYILNMNEFCV